MVWARKDSRPLLKAKEPRGSAVSDSSRRAWRDGVVEAGIVSFARSHDVVEREAEAVISSGKAEVASKL